MKLSASSPDQGESSELMPVDVDGESMAIALNYHYVFDCVNAPPPTVRNCCLSYKATCSQGFLSPTGR